MENLVQIAEGQVVVSSRQVAEHFEKRHTHVLTVIKEILNSAENSAQWFFKAEYKDASGKSNPEYLMNRDGFSLLVMGFTGKKALEWKIKYIQAFNAMEEELRHGGAPYVLIMKRYKNRPVLSTADVAALLGTARESISQTLQEPLAKCKHGQDYYLVQGENLVMLKRDNPSISALASSVLLIAESGLRKVCAFLKMAMPAVFGAASAAMMQPKKEVVATETVQVRSLKVRPLVVDAPRNETFQAWKQSLECKLIALREMLPLCDRYCAEEDFKGMGSALKALAEDIYVKALEGTRIKYDLIEMPH